MIYNPEWGAIDKAFNIFSQMFYDQYPYHIEEIPLTISSEINFTSGSKKRNATLGAASFYIYDLNCKPVDVEINLKQSLRL